MVCGDEGDEGSLLLEVGASWSGRAQAELALWCPVWGGVPAHLHRLEVFMIYNT